MKTWLIQIRVSEAQKRAYVIAADAEGLTLSEWLRSLADKALAECEQ